MHAIFQGQKLGLRMKDHQLESYNLSKIIVDYHLHYKHFNSITAVTKVEMLHPQLINCCLHLVSCVGDFIPDQSSLEAQINKDNDKVYLQCFPCVPAAWLSNVQRQSKIRNLNV